MNTNKQGRTPTYNNASKIAIARGVLDRPHGLWRFSQKV